MSNMTKAQLELKIHVLTHEKSELAEKVQYLRQRNNTLSSESRNTIGKLKDELYHLTKDNERLLDEIQSDSFYNSAKIQELKYEYNNHIQKLHDTYKNQIQKLHEEHENEIQLLQEKHESEIQLLRGEKRKHNERNAGRKSIITQELKQSVIDMYRKGATQKLISVSLEVSIGTVNKIIKENNSINKLS